MADLILLNRLFARVIENKPGATKISSLRWVKLSEKRAPKNVIIPVLLLISNLEIRNDLLNLLEENHYSPILIADLAKLLQFLRRRPFAIVFTDCGAVTSYGPGILAKIKVACRHCRIIFLCDKGHLCDKTHRNLIKEVLEIGVYACILAPYKDWEVLSLISFYPQKEKNERSRAAKKS